MADIESNSIVNDESLQQTDAVLASTTITGGSTGNDPVSDKATIARLSVQLKRLNDANVKYKNLLKLAKERIEQKEIEANSLQNEHAQLTERIAEFEEKEALWTLNTSTSKNQRGNGTSTDESVAASRQPSSGSVAASRQPSSGLESSILRICQRIKNKVNDDTIEIWALLEMQTMTEDASNSRRFREWVKFDTEQQLQDYIRQDTGEPITVPPYSLSQEQSNLIQEQAEQQIAKVNDEFRRFRVKSEMARKQSETLIRELQATLTQNVAQRIENGDEESTKRGKLNGNSTMTESEHVRSLSNQIEKLKVEMSKQEARWKQSYEALVAENTALKSSGSEALLAAQWRQRYEQCLKEKEDILASKSKHSIPSTISDNEYEAKYRDLKESFRIYRKKAKEIFEAQQLSSGSTLPSSVAMSITSNSSADAKLSYLKNLMINYFTADPSVRDHMLGAIGTVLQFTPDEQKRIDSKKASQASTSWF